MVFDAFLATFLATPFGVGRCGRESLLTDWTASATFSAPRTGVGGFVRRFALMRAGVADLAMAVRQPRILPICSAFSFTPRTSPVIERTSLASLPN